MRQTTTPVPVEGGVAGGALPMSAGTSPHGRRKPNGSACHRRTMAGVQEEAKHAIKAMSPLKSCDVEKPQPSGRCRKGAGVGDDRPLAAVARGPRHRALGGTRRRCSISYLRLTQIRIDANEDSRSN